MALNINDFIFHSDFLYEQKIEENTVAVSVTGTVAAGAIRTWASAWQDIAYGATGVRGVVAIPGNTLYPTINSATYQLPASLIYDGSFNSFYARVEVQSNRYRAVVFVNNPYASAISSPGRTFTFRISTYLPQ